MDPPTSWSHSYRIHARLGSALLGSPRPYFESPWPLLHTCWGPSATLPVTQSTRTQGYPLPKLPVYAPTVGRSHPRPAQEVRARRGRERELDQGAVNASSRPAADNGPERGGEHPPTANEPHGHRGRRHPASCLQRVRAEEGKTPPFRLTNCACESGGLARVRPIFDTAQGANATTSVTALDVYPRQDSP